MWSADWPFQQPRFDINPSSDICIILKTGFGTRERVPAWLEALPRRLSGADIVLIGDFHAKRPFNTNERDLPLVNIVSWMLERRYVPEDLTSTRLEQYSELTTAIANGDEGRASELSKSFGWELDAMKFIPGLELAYSMCPDKKWYVLVDDDTYLIEPSFSLILRNYDPARPYYIGNAVGDYKRRFAHGGSSIILSQAAMRQLYILNPRIVRTAYLESLEETWGDRLLAAALARAGVYLDERSSRLFNGEPPEKTKLRSDRLCLPIATFHKFDSGAMRDVGATFRDVTAPVRWVDLWDMYRGASGTKILELPLGYSAEGWDYVGRLDEHTRTFKSVSSPNDCRRLCRRARDQSCLAWTWERESKDCHTAPWVVIGDKAPGRTSGIAGERIRKLASGCLRL
ncbi:hypothetical protein VTK73DRAFT_4748 [Phialemonium thermophilum]|uniref:N-acetylgalactosaminide beta-1,3-galactosyltransferase n=1 Tax=Phialemonium thermophilum TaxID=223376 RepID=A0ABR3WSG3_9PEZI